jgi:voltage-gated potassium channel
MKFLMSQLAYLLKQPQQREDLGRLSRLLLFTAALMTAYTVTFHALMVYEGQQHSWLSGLYWTVVTMTTLGFGDITFESDLGRAFTILVLVSGVFMLLIVVPFAFIRFFYAPWMEARLKLRAPRSVPADVKDHVVLCANDAIATDLRERLRLARIPHFVLEADPAVSAHLHGDGVPVIAADPQDVASWRAVGIERARAVVANLDDAANTNVILTVRQLAPSVDVIAIAEHEESIDLLELAGATHVLPVKHRLGEQLANRVNAGHAEVHTLGHYRDLVIGEFPVHNTPLVGRSLRDLALRSRIGVTVVGVWERGKFEPASPDHVLTPTSVPVVIASPAQIMALNELLVIYDTNYAPTLVIGGGKVGHAAVATLKTRDVAVHVVDQDPAARERLAGLADKVFVGQAADRELLRAAGIDKAPSVILTTNDDSINIYLAVYCRRLNPELRIISRITHEKNLEAVHRAGADFVIGYSWLGAEFVFSTLQGRSLMMFGGGVELFTLDVPSTLVGKTLQDTAGALGGVNVIAIQRDGEIHAAPSPTVPLPAQSELLVVGTHEQRQRFARRFS